MYKLWNPRVNSSGFWIEVNMNYFFQSIISSSRHLADTKWGHDTDEQGCIYMQILNSENRGYPCRAKSMVIELTLGFIKIVTTGYKSNEYM